MKKSVYFIIAIIIVFCMWLINALPPIMGLAIAIVMGIAYMFMARIWYAKLFVGANKKLVKPLFTVIGPILFVALFSINSIQKYTHPSTKIFTKGNYHVLEHQGYYNNNEIILSSESMPEQNLCSDLNGSVKIIKADSGEVQLKVKACDKPLFVQTKEKSDNYRLCMPDKACIPLKESIKIMSGNEILLDLKIIPVKYRKNLRKRYKTLYIVNGDTSYFERTISIGYALNNIISKVPNNEVPSEPFIGSYLLRSVTHLNAETNYNKSFVFFPGRALFGIKDLKIMLDGSENDYAEKLMGVYSSEYRELLKPGVNFSWGFDELKSDRYQAEVLADGKLFLKYPISKKYPLSKGVGTHKQFVFSNYNDIAGQDLNGGFILGMLNGNSIHQVKAELEYEIPDNNDDKILKCSIITLEDKKKKLITTGEQFSIASTHKDSSVEWVLQITDRRAENTLTALKIKQILWVLLLLIILRFIVIHRLALKSKNRAFSPERNLLDASIWLIIIVLVTVRLIVTWRVSTFPPLSGISPKEWFQFVDVGGDVKKLIYQLAIYYVALLVFDFIYAYKSKETRNDLVRSFKYNNSRVVFILKSLHERVISLYSFIGLQKMLKDVMLVFRKRKDKWYIKTLEFLFATWFGWVIIAGVGLSALAWLTSFEPRLSSIYLPISYYFVVSTFVRRIYEPVKNKKGKSAKAWLVTTIAWLFTVFILINDFGYLLIFLIAWFLHLVFVQWMLDKDFSEKSSFRKRLTLDGFIKPGKSKAIFSWGVVSILTSVLIISGLDLSKTDFAEKLLLENDARFNYRVQVLEKSADDLFSSTINNKDGKLFIDGERMRYLFWAAHNQAFINEYHDKAKELNHYFNLQRHFNVGVPYFIQTTDIAPLRFFIAEHKGAQWFIVLLLTAFFLLSVLFVALYPIKVLVNRSVLGVLFLFLITIFVLWLIVTNRFVFIGQDFPFLSITSVLAVLLPLTLFLIVLIIPIRFKQNSNDEITPVNMLGMGVSIFVVFISIGAYFYLNKPNNEESEVKVGVFDLNNTVAKINSAVNTLNCHFENFQEEQTNNHISGNKIVQDFFNTIDIYSLLEDSISIAAIEAFKNEPAKRDIDNLIYLQKRNDLWKIKMSRSFFRLTMPSAYTYQWHGNIYGEGKSQWFLTNKNTAINLTKAKELSLKDLGEIRMISEEPKLFINKNKEDYEVILDEEKIKSGVCVLKDKSSLTIKRNDGLDSYIIKKQKPMLARAVQINGRPTHIYPAGESSMWVKNLKNIVSEVNSNQNKQFKAFNTTMDYELNNQVHTILQQFNINANLKKVNDAYYEQLHDFYLLSYEQKNSIFNNNMFVFDGKGVVIKDKSKFTAEAKELCELINKELPNKDITPQDINDAIRFNLGKADANVIAVDGNGRIILMADNGRYRKVDPNNKRLLAQIVRQLQVESSYILENDIYGNKVYQKYRRGPGSTVKPLFYASVISQKKLDWEKFEIVTGKKTQTKIKNKTFDRLFVHSPDDSTGIKNIALHKTNKKKLLVNNYYAGKCLGLQEAVSPDSNLYDHLENKEGRFAGKYLTCSDNVYQSFITFIGSYTDRQLDNLTGNKANSILVKTKNKQPTALTFPLIDVGKSNFYTFNSKYWPKAIEHKNYFGHRHSILADGLRNNFGLSTLKDTSQVEKLDTNIISSVKPMLLGMNDYLYDNKGNVLLRKYPFSFPNAASFYQKERTREHNFVHGVRNPSLGSYPFATTPTFMVQAYARLFSMNANLMLTLNNDYLSSEKKADWDYDEQWTTKSLLRAYKNLIYSPLSKVINTNAEWNGTLGYNSFLKRIIEKPQINLVNEKQRAISVDGKTYYLYAKTGTMSDSKVDGKDMRDKMLAVVISDTYLEQINNYEELQQVKQYTLYFSFIDVEVTNFNAMNQVRVDIIAEVLKSHSFKQYMN